MCILSLFGKTLLMPFIGCNHLKINTFPRMAGLSSEFYGLFAKINNIFIESNVKVSFPLQLLKALSNKGNMS